MSNANKSRKHKSPAWPLMLVLVLLPVLSACSLTAEPVSRPRSTSTPAQQTQPASQQNDTEAQNNGSGGGSTAPANQQAGGSAGAAWQIPAEQQAVVRVVDQVNPAVVTVVNRLDPQRTGFGGEARGSGVVIDEDGRIITNNHVIEGAATGGLQVIFLDGTIVPARLIGADPSNDLAVLKVDEGVLAVATLADSNRIRVGETVIAIGSALGDFTNTVTVGVVSGTDRDLEGGDIRLENLIQTDAAINRGNSGGALLNLSGQVIGINTAVVRGGGEGDVAEGLGFAIPSNRVRAIASQLIEREGQPRPFLGVATQALTPQIASYYDLRGPDGRLLSYGALVTEVVQGSAADQANLAPGDVILSIDGTRLDENSPLADVMAQYSAGDRIRLEVVRNGEAQTITVTLGAR